MGTATYLRVVTLLGQMFVTIHSIGSIQVLVKSVVFLIHWLRSLAVKDIEIFYDGMVLGT